MATLMGQVSQFDASNNGARNDDREASIFVDAKRASDRHPLPPIL
jgi:hypothetical protein